MRTSIRTSLLRVVTATALAVSVVGSTGPASAGMRAGGGGGFHGGGGFGGFHGGGFGGRGFGARGFADRGFHHGFGFRDRRFAFVGGPGWGGYYCNPYVWSVNPWMCY
jgi:hypothetical protein